MAISVASMTDWCRALLTADAGAKRTLADYLDGIPRLDQLADVPSGTPVLVRGDLDAKPGKTVGEGDVRLRSMVDTLKFGIAHGWKQVLFGHIGRKPEGSLKAVAARLGELLGTDVPLVEDWYDSTKGEVSEAVRQRIAAAAPGSVLVLENTRRYDIERVLWDAEAADAAKVAEPLAKFANEMAAKVAKVYVHEAFSAGSLDSSSVVVPAAMDRVALGHYEAGEFDGPMRRCLATQLVIFSGLKADKLDDLGAMIDRGTVRWVFTAGSLAMALKKAEAQLRGSDFCIGIAEATDHQDKPYFVPQHRLDQARQMLEQGRAKGIEFVLPVDFVLQDGRVAEQIGPTDQQLDVGPKTSELFAQKIGEFIAHPAAGCKKVAFYNGVFGKFEEPMFEGGTKRFIPQLERMRKADVEVYVGGGEGGAALERFGQPDWVTHCFTAGGTVLNALGSQPVPYLVALHRAAAK